MELELIEKVGRGVAVRALSISPDHNYFGHHGQPAGQSETIETQRIECVAGHGVRGDRFFDYKKHYKGQITFFSWETFEGIRRTLNIWDRPVMVFRRNVVTEGMDLNMLIGRDFWLQGVHFRGVEECRPCYWMDLAFGSGACEFLKGRGGLRAEILADGCLCVDAP
jgi:MOSC domain-containing protein YiiM